jgi:predicted metal-dependent HD superfamily phosphohydrolase
MPNASRDNWCTFWKGLGATNDPAPIYSVLVAHYTETHRAYHNLNHIDACLGELGSARQLTKNAEALEAAIWFHDVIYDTHAKDNEELSAALARATIKTAGLPDRFADTVSRLILATKHTSGSSEPDEALLIDVDLSILGQPAETFDEYERQIRAEYSWVAKAVFAAGRAAILDLFLARDFIYSTEVFRKKYEARARANLRRSISHLKAGSGQAGD